MRKRKDDPSFYHFLLIHSHFISFSGMFPHKLTGTYPNDFAWGISAFWVLVTLVGMTELEAHSPNSSVSSLRPVSKATNWKW